MIRIYYIFKNCCKQSDVKYDDDTMITIAHNKM